MTRAVARRHVLGPVARDGHAQGDDRGEGQARQRPALRGRPAGGACRRWGPSRPRRRNRNRASSTTPTSAITMFSVWPVPKRKTVRGIVAREIDEEAEERIPEDEVRGDGAGRRVATPHPQQEREQRQVLGRVVEHDRVSEALGVGELHGPGHAGDAPDNLPVDEVPDAADGHQEGAGDHERVGKLGGTKCPSASRTARRRRAADEQAVRGHAAQPQRGDQPDAVAIERPFVERDLDRAATDQDPGGEPDREPVTSSTPRPRRARCRRIQRCISRKPSA